jgi:hypothetical protein
LPRRAARSGPVRRAHLAFAIEALDHPQEREEGRRPRGLVIINPRAIKLSTKLSKPEKMARILA